MNCVDLRGVGTGTSWGRCEERGTNFYLVPKFAESREAHRGPSLRGSTSGNLLGKNRGLVEVVQEERQSRDGWRNVRTDWSVPGTQTARTRARRNLVRSLTRVRPSIMPLGSPRPAARDGRRRTPGESLSPKRCPASRMGPVSGVNTRYGSRPTSPGWRGWVELNR